MSKKRTSNIVKNIMIDDDGGNCKINSKYVRTLFATYTFVFVINNNKMFGLVLDIGKERRGRCIAFLWL